VNHNTTHTPRKRVSFYSVHEYLPVALSWLSGDELEPDGPVPVIGPENSKALEIPVFFENVVSTANVRPQVIIEFRSRIVQYAFDQFKGLVQVARFPERETIRRRPLSQLHLIYRWNFFSRFSIRVARVLARRSRSHSSASSSTSSSIWRGAMLWRNQSARVFGARTLGGFFL